jgi:putative NADH-flavin reductase
MSAVLSVIHPAPSLDALCAQWVEAKQAENAANARRVAIEQEITAITGVREEGSETHATESGMKVTVTGKLNIKADLDALMTLSAGIPEHMRPLKTETVADEKGLKYLRTNEPLIWSHIAPAIEVKAGKPSVVVKVA